MARIAFNSTAGNTGGGGWSPLPAGDIAFQIDKVEETVSKQNNPQLKVSMHVIDGPNMGAKATTWYSLLPQAAFNMEALLNAVLDENEYTAIETGEFRERNGEQEPIYTFEFDTDDLVGREVIYDVTVGEYNGKPKNEFNSPRPMNADAPAPRAAAPAPRAAAPAVATRAAAPATRAAAPAQRQATVAQPARRTVGR
jgi:pyruvate/2-oxoglutarate dehydrogenase complex dihydrolipoamide acyltransferase (E2) component